MSVTTRFGKITFPQQLLSSRQKAILRALNWCDELASLSGCWSRDKHASSFDFKLLREINGRTVSIHPLAAAKLDAGMEVAGFSVGHVPVYVDGNRICVVAGRKGGIDLHTDLAASLILLLSQSEPDHTTLPKTLARALYPEIYFTRGHEWRERPANAQRRREVFNAFRAEVAIGEWGPGPCAENLPVEDWQVLRDYYPWDEEPELAIEVADWMMDELQRPVNDHLWVMSMFREHEPMDYQRIMLPAYLRFHYPELRAAALREYRPDDPEIAWENLEPCLEDEWGHLAVQAHETLQGYDQLEHRLVNHSLALLDEGAEGVFQTSLVAWLSHRMDMDDAIQDILPTLEPYQLGRFLHEIETSGPWFEEFGVESLSSPFEGVHMGLVDCSARNLSFNPFNLWLPLMQQGTGTMKLAILRNLHRVTEEQAHVLLELGWKSRWRFVINKTHQIVEKYFPDYPDKEVMLEHGFRSVEYWTQRPR